MKLSIDEASRTQITTTYFRIGRFSDPSLLTSEKWKPFLDEVKNFMNSNGQGRRFAIVDQSLDLSIEQRANTILITPEEILSKVQELYEEHFGESPE